MSSPNRILWCSILPSAFLRLPEKAPNGMEPVSWTIHTEDGFWFDLHVRKSSSELTMVLLGSPRYDDLTNKGIFRQVPVLLIHSHKELLQFLHQLYQQGWKLSAVTPLENILEAVMQGEIDQASFLCTSVLYCSPARKQQTDNPTRRP